MTARARALLTIALVNAPSLDEMTNEGLRRSYRLSPREIDRILAAERSRRETANDRQPGGAGDPVPTSPAPSGNVIVNRSTP